MKWYKRDPDAALAGMIGLSPEQRGVYNTVIDLLYSRNGSIPTDDAFFARACECRPQMWRRIRDSLIAKGKLHYTADDKLMAKRVQNELETATKLIQNMVVLGRVSAEKRKQNNTTPPTAPLVTTTTRYKEERKIDMPPSAAASESKGRPRKRAKTEMPEGWLPRIPLLPSQLQQFERFRDSAIANGRVYANWDAAWRNWIDPSNPYNQEKGSGNGTNGNRYREAYDRLFRDGETGGPHAIGLLQDRGRPRPGNLSDGGDSRVVELSDRRDRAGG
jgi:uncharacterized protein YdaU (DUF1376 family)